MANVVVRLRYFDVKLRIRRHMKLLTCLAGNPRIAARQLVFAAAAHAFHDFRGSGAKSQRAGQHHTYRLFGAVGQGKAVADAFAVKVHIGSGGEGNVGEGGSGHGSSQCDRLGGAKW